VDKYVKYIISIYYLSLISNFKPSLMKKLLFILILFPVVSFSQMQIGDDIDGEAANDQSGSSVSISSDGTIVAIGAPFNDGKGHVRIYNYDNSTWSTVGQDIDGEAAGDQSGYSVSLSSDGSVVAIGAPFNNGTGSDAGHVRLYENIGNVWTEKGNEINAEAFGDYSGWSVSLSSDGNTVAIGAYGNDSNGGNSGHVRVYNFDGTDWIQLGDDIDGETAGDRSGLSVSLSSDGNTVAIGADFNAGNGNFSGHVRVYNYNSTDWIQKGSDIDGEFSFDQSGYSVSLSADGNVVAIGSTRNSSKTGHVRVYNYVSNWVQIGADIDGEVANDLSGYSVSLSDDGSIVAIGARSNSSSAGHVRVYKNTSSTWNQVGVDIDGEASSDYSGTIVSLSSDGYVVAIGAPGNDGNGDSAGQLRVYNLSASLSSDNAVLSSFEVFPNPTSEQFSIELKKGFQLKKVSIYNQLAQFIKEEKRNVIDVSKLSKGIYFVQIETNQGKATKKVVIE
jgi:hypothetical protein